VKTRADIGAGLSHQQDTFASVRGSPPQFGRHPTNPGRYSAGTACAASSSRWARWISISFGQTCRTFNRSTPVVQDLPGLHAAGLRGVTRVHIRQIKAKALPKLLSFLEG
jgi:hypothetical protein